MGKFLDRLEMRLSYWRSRRSPDPVGNTLLDPHITEPAIMTRNPSLYENQRVIVAGYPLLHGTWESETVVPDMYGTGVAYHAIQYDDTYKLCDPQLPGESIVFTMRRRKNALPSSVLVQVSGVAIVHDTNIFVTPGRSVVPVPIERT